jgi:propanol-preferring alcohol dehydrogenase
MTTMTALRLMGWKQEPVLEEVQVPTPGPKDVVIKVGGAGACHSDLHLMHEFEEGLLPWAPPFTLGHENAGWVSAVGADVRGYAEGDAVAVMGAWGCGRCKNCMLGMDTYCENVMEAPVPGGGGGLGLDGGMAEYMLIRDAERHLVRLPAGMEPHVAAPLTDAGLTPYHAVRRSAGKLIDPRTTAVAIGVGGLGLMGVQILKALTPARVIAVDMRADALEAATASGADHVLVSDESAGDKIRELTGGVGADVVLDFVGAQPTVELGAKIVRQLGDLTIVGIGGGVLPVGFFSLPYEASVQTTYWGSHSELAEVIDLGARGLLHPPVTTYKLADAAAAYHDLADGKVVGRAVVVP